MALSEQLEELAHKHGAIAYQSRTGEQRYGFTPAGLLNLMAEVTGEVLKQDDALIRKMREALRHARTVLNHRNLHQLCGPVNEAIAAANARLGESQ